MSGKKKSAPYGDPIFDRKILSRAEARERYMKLSPEARDQVNRFVDNNMKLRLPEHLLNVKLDPRIAEHRPHIKDWLNMRDRIISGKTNKEWEQSARDNLVPEKLLKRDVSAIPKENLLDKEPILRADDGRLIYTGKEFLKYVEGVLSEKGHDKPAFSSDSTKSAINIIERINAEPTASAKIRKDPNAYKGALLLLNEAVEIFSVTGSSRLIITAPLDKKKAEKAIDRFMWNIAAKGDEIGGGLGVKDYTFSNAYPVTATLTKDGKINLHIEQKHQVDYYNDKSIRGFVPQIAFTKQGLTLEPYQFIRIKLADEGNITVVRPAAELLAITEKQTAERWRTINDVCQIAVDVMTLGMGTLAAGAWKSVEKGFTIANVIATSASLAARENRGWLIEHCGDEGRKFVERLDLISTLVGLSQLGVSLKPGTAENAATDLSKSYDELKQVSKNLGESDLQRFRQITRGMEDAAPELGEAFRAARKVEKPPREPLNVETPAISNEPRTPGSVLPERPHRSVISPPNIITDRGSLVTSKRKLARELVELMDSGKPGLKFPRGEGNPLRQHLYGDPEHAKDFARISGFEGTYEAISNLEKQRLPRLEKRALREIQNQDLGTLTDELARRRVTENLSKQGKKVEDQPKPELRKLVGEETTKIQSEMAPSEIRQELAKKMAAEQAFRTSSRFYNQRIINEALKALDQPDTVLFIADYHGHPDFGGKFLGRQLNLEYTTKDGHRALITWTEDGQILNTFDVKREGTKIGTKRDGSPLNVPPPEATFKNTEFIQGTKSDWLGTRGRVDGEGKVQPIPETVRGDTLQGLGPPRNDTLQGLGPSLDKTPPSRGPTQEPPSRSPKPPAPPRDTIPDSTSDTLPGPREPSVGEPLQRSPTHPSQRGGSPTLIPYSDGNIEFLGQATAGKAARLGISEETLDRYITDHFFIESVKSPGSRNIQQRISEKLNTEIDKTLQLGQERARELIDFGYRPDGIAGFIDAKTKEGLTISQIGERIDRELPLMRYLRDHLVPGTPEQKAAGTRNIIKACDGNVDEAMASELWNQKLQEFHRKYPGESPGRERLGKMSEEARNEVALIRQRLLRPTTGPITILIGTELLNEDSQRKTPTSALPSTKPRTITEEGSEPQKQTGKVQEKETSATSGKFTEEKKDTLQPVVDAFKPKDTIAIDFPENTDKTDSLKMQFSTPERSNKPNEENLDKSKMEELDNKIQVLLKNDVQEIHSYGIKWDRIYSTVEQNIKAGFTAEETQSIIGVDRKMLDKLNQACNGNKDAAIAALRKNDANIDRALVDTLLPTALAKEEAKIRSELNNPKFKAGPITKARVSERLSTSVKDLRSSMLKETLPDAKTSDAKFVGDTKRMGDRESSSERVSGDAASQQERGREAAAGKLVSQKAEQKGKEPSNKTTQETQKETKKQQEKAKEKKDEEKDKEHRASFG